jgi:hypothetical protein
VLRNIYTILKRPFNGFYFGHKQQDLGQKIHILPFLAKLFYKKCVAVVIRVILAFPPERFHAAGHRRGRHHLQGRFRAGVLRTRRTSEVLIGTFFFSSSSSSPFSNCPFSFTTLLTGMS